MSRRRLLALAAVAAAALVAVLATSLDVDGGAGKAQASTAGATAATGRGCGVAGGAQATLAVYEAAAARIYEGERKGREVAADAARVRGYGPLLDALSFGGAAAIRAAVHAIVYTPHWHIVRLRVLARGRVLADVGGPYVLAPVTGVLRLHGRVLGSYVMSVQDDVGYVKLVSRFIGAPVDLYVGGTPLMGTLRPAPPSAATAGAVQVAGASYAQGVLTLQAFPAGALQAALFAGRPSRAQAAQGCAAFTLAAWGQVARHIAARFKPLSGHYQDLANLIATVTGGHAFVLAGSHPLTGGALPAGLASATGSVRYAGRLWPVYSWQPQAGVRVCFLTPGAPPAA